MHEYHGRFGSVVIDFAYLYLAFIIGAEYGVDERTGGGAKGYLGYGESLVV